MRVKPPYNIVKEINTRKIHSVAVAGFTLLEVMVAMAIIAIVFVSIFRMHSQTIEMNNRARFDITASLLAQKKIAELQIKPLNEISDSSEDFGDEFAGYICSVSVEDVETENLEDIANILKKIDVTVTFGEGEYIYGFRRYRLAQE